MTRKKSIDTRHYKRQVTCLAGSILDSYAQYCASDIPLPEGVIDGCSEASFHRNNGVVYQARIKDSLEGAIGVFTADDPHSSDFDPETDLVLIGVNIPAGPWHDEFTIKDFADRVACDGHGDPVENYILSIDLKCALCEHEYTYALQLLGEFEKTMRAR